MTITENRKLYALDIQRVCIEKGWYENGTNEDYEALLNRVAVGENVTAETLFEIAKDIYEHSANKTDWFEKEEENIKNIMYYLAKACVTTFKFEK